MIPQTILNFMLDQNSNSPEWFIFRGKAVGDWAGGGREEGIREETDGLEDGDILIFEKLIWIAILR